MATRRVTYEQLLSLANSIANVLGVPGPDGTWVKREDGTYRANVGSLNFSFSAGSAQLEQIVNGCGAVRTLLSTSSKSALFDAMHAFLAGARAMSNQHHHVLMGGPQELDGE
jgi:hypothetical protein